MNNQESKVLIVDDSSEIREVIRILLESEGYKTQESTNGTDAIAAVSDDNSIELVILDIMMPGISGFETCKKIREFSSIPIMFLTAKSQEIDKETAYLQGGDDYLVKPFSGPELVMKVGALIRRYSVYKGKKDLKIENNLILLDDISIDMVKRSVIKDDERIFLTEKEYDILLFLTNNRGTIFSAQSIFENVWGLKYLSNSGNTIMVHILNLRRKLENDPENPQIIKTVWGKGYTID